MQRTKDEIKGRAREMKDVDTENRQPEGDERRKGKKVREREEDERTRGQENNCAIADLASKASEKMRRAQGR